MNAARKYPDGTEERRAAAEIRTAGRTLQGYVAKFGVKADLPGFTETIQAGAFRSSLAASPDILACVDHDLTRVLGRTKSGTLRLVEDNIGLSFSLDVPDTQLGRDTLTMAIRNDLGGMSFGFRVVAEAWPTPLTRTLIEISLVECSVIAAWPAYPQTTVSARARAMGHAEAAQRVRRMAILGIV